MRMFAHWAIRCLIWLAWLGAVAPAACGSLARNHAGNANALGTPEANSGIYGTMVTAWGNPPANPPTYKCVKVLDANGQRLVAEGTCSGMWGKFRVALPPGVYILEAGGSWEASTGGVHFVPNRRRVEVSSGQWVQIAPPTPPGPVP